MREPGRLLLVANRAPLSFALAGGRLRAYRGVGGLVTALRPIARLAPASWLGIALSAGDRAVTERLRDRGALLGRGRLAIRLATLPPDLLADHYGGFCNRVLWFVQHGLWSRRIDPEHEDRLRALAARYLAANRAVADLAYRELHRPGGSGAALVHDYHLYAVPRLLRSRLRGALVAHFVHVPWPDLAVWRETLPDAVTAALVEGLLGADVVHFQDAASRDAFAGCVDAIVPRARARDGHVQVDGRQVVLRVRPVSIDPASLRPRRDVVGALHADPRALLVRVDRLDPIKNVPAGFLAFRRMLERHPEWVGRVRFVARVVPSRTAVPEYRRERESARLLAAEINARFGAGTVDLREQADRARALSELAAADAVLVNSLADGMNLVAKEAALLNDRLALVLSRRTGAYAELEPGAIGIEPHDVDGTAAALHRALSMEEPERRARSARLSAAVLRWTARDWLRAVLLDLEEAASARRAALAAAG